MRRVQTERGFSIVEVLVIVLMMAILGAMAVPMTGGVLSGYRLRSESKNIASLVALAKLRAAANFTRARVRVNLVSGSYRMEVWNKTTNTWVMEGARRVLAPPIRYGFLSLDTPPPNTQVDIDQSDSCRTGIGVGAGALLWASSCIIFNSRGIPINTAGAPIGGNAFYLTDGSSVRATTVTATPLIREWWSKGTDAAWVRQ